MASQSVFRGPGAKHYAVVHRSMRDPLINDPEAGDRVLAEVTRANAERRVGKPVTRGELEASLDGNHQRANVGEASLYDIYFDDTEYDYMQHLRPTGQPEAFFVEAPERQGGSKGKREAGRADEIIALRGDAAGAGSDDIVLPQGVRPTPDASTLSYKDHLEFALPANSARIGGGLQPDMDPGLREVLEALDDDEYVEDAADDDFFGGLVEDGEREEDEVPAWSANGGGQAMDSQWDRLVGTVKQAAKARSGPMMEDGSGEGSEDEAEYASEAGDTIAELRASSMRRPPRQGGAVAGSAFSMSSSAMFRNEGLTSLDERFDQIEKEYENSSTSGSDGEPEDIDNTSMQASHASVLNRADLDDIFDDFLDHYEVLGGKLKGKLEGETPLDKLATMRKELARISDDPQLAEGEERARTKADILARVERAERREAERRAKGKYREERTSVEVEDDPAERWDCQTILSTYSNVSNHPRLVRMREAVGTRLAKSTSAQISIDRKTGFPIVDGRITGGPGLHGKDAGPNSGREDSDGEDEDEQPIHGTVSRDRTEGKEEKKARKAAVKSERSARRQQKKQVREAFAGERKKQQRAEDRMASRRAADVGGHGTSVMSLS